MISQKEIKGYLKKVKKNCPYSLRLRLSAELESAILEYAEENPDKDLADLISRFGKAEKYAEEYLMNMPIAERTKILKKGKTIITAVIVGVIAVVLIVASTAVWIIYDDHRTDIDHVEIYITKDDTIGG